MFTVSVKGYSTEVEHNASSTDLERALMNLPSVTAVLVSRSRTNQSARVALHVLGVFGRLASGRHLLTGRARVLVTSSLQRARFGDPALYKIDLTHDAHQSIHALITQERAEFCANRFGYAKLLHIFSVVVLTSRRHRRGSRKPIPRVAVGTVEEEVDGVAEFNRGLDHAYPPHSLPGPNSSVEAHLLSLSNWADLGEGVIYFCVEARQCGDDRVAGHLLKYASCTTFVEGRGRRGNDNRNPGVLHLGRARSAHIGLTPNTSITKSKSYASSGPQVAFIR